jgi:hypothetical protein
MRIPTLLFLLLGATVSTVGAQQRTSPWAPHAAPTPVSAAVPAIVVGVPLMSPARGGTPAATAARRRHALVGAGIGLVVGAVVTHAFLYSGDSTSLCDRSANQDAINRRECNALVGAGGVLGAGVGATVGHWLGRR